MLEKIWWKNVPLLKATFNSNRIIIEFGVKKRGRLVISTGLEYYVWLFRFRQPQVKNLLQTRLGIRVTFLSFELEACDPIPGLNGLHPSQILLASAISMIRVGTGNRAFQARGGVNSLSSLIPSGEYISQYLTPENRIYVNHVLETLRWPNENVLGRYERDTSSKRMCNL